MTEIKNLLFVCYGNTARSPVAWALARDYKKNQAKLSEINFDSAGFINAFSFMQPESSAFLDLKGIYYSDFRPKTLNRPLLEKQDLIITMEQSHKQEILRRYRDIQNIEKKIFTLKEFNGEQKNIDIIDPYYTNSNTYEKIMHIIDKNIEKMVIKLKSMIEME